MQAVQVYDVSRKPSEKKPMKLVTVHLPIEYILALREMVEWGRFPNVSEAIRAAVRDLLNREYWPQKYIQMIQKQKNVTVPLPLYTG